MTGSYRSVTAFSLAALLFVSAIVPNVFAETHLYVNEENGFSLTIPENWSMQEGGVVQEMFAAEIVLYPDEFGVDNHDGEYAEIAGLIGLDFVINSPKIAISASTGMEPEMDGMESDFSSNIISTDELRMQDINENNILDYYTAAIGTIPYSEILGEYTASHPWGYEAGVEYYLGAVDGEGFEAYNGEDIIFAFDDNDVYLVSYSSPEVEYEKHIPAFDAVIDSLVIKSVNVPAFGQNPIEISTDKQLYSAGQTVQVTGSVAQLLGGFDITMKVTSPHGHIVQVSQVTVDPDGTFDTTVPTYGVIGKFAGTYTIEVQYGPGRTALTTFELTDKPVDVKPPDAARDKTAVTDGMLVIETDRETYTAGQTVQVTGSVAQLDEYDIVMRIMGPANQLVQTDQIEVGPDRTFGSTIALVEYPWTSLGTYAVNIQYGVGSHAQTTFELTDMPADVRPPDAVRDKTAVTDGMLVVETDRETYTAGQTVQVTGSVAQLLGGFDITMKVTSPNGSIVQVGNTVVNPDGTFDTTVPTYGVIGKFAGTYTIEVQYGPGRTALTTFELIGASSDVRPPDAARDKTAVTDGMLVVETDRETYTAGQTVQVTGSVAQLLGGFDITMKVTSPNGSIVQVGNTVVDPDGTFDTTVPTGGAIGKFAGTYTIEVQYGPGRTALTTFELIGASSDVRPPDAARDKTAVTDGMLVVETDRETYTAGQTVQVTGSVAQLLGGFDITMKVTSPNGSIVQVGNTVVDPDGTFDTTVPTGGAIGKFAGTYTIEVQYGPGRTALTTFELIGASSDVRPPDAARDKTAVTDGMLVVETDRETYTAGQTVQVTGSVAQLDEYDIVMRIMGPANQLVQTDKIEVGPDGTFGSTIALVEYPWTSLGTYAVNIQYGVGSHAQTTFELTDMPADVRP